jgi:prevent-host-death family protein
MQYSLTEARRKLPQLIKSAERGELVTICRRGVPIVEVVRTTRSARKKPKFGTMRGKIKVIDPDWWKPMTDKEVKAFLNGRY